MSLGSWNPDDGSEPVTYQLDCALLQQLADFVSNDDWQQQLCVFIQQLPSDANAMMKLDAATWMTTCSDWARPSIWQLIQFFTVIEQQNALYNAGDKSPVIGLNKLLKQRQQPLSRDEVLWIKAHSDNRFLPNGPLL